MKKTIREYDGEKMYLLGISKGGDRVYLNSPSFDCKWYWGLGYIKEFTPHAKSWNCHTHFNGLFLENNLHDSFKAYFSETVLTDNETWKLLEYMKTLYELRDLANSIYTKGSHITSNDYMTETLCDIDNLYRDRINNVLIPGLWQRVAELLTEVQ